MLASWSFKPQAPDAWEAKEVMDAQQMSRDVAKLSITGNTLNAKRMFDVAKHAFLVLKQEDLP